MNKGESGPYLKKYPFYLNLYAYIFNSEGVLFSWEICCKTLAKSFVFARPTEIISLVAPAASYIALVVIKSYQGAIEAWVGAGADKAKCCASSLRYSKHKPAAL